MFKIRLKRVVLIAFLLVVVAVIAGCSECKDAVDCAGGSACKSTSCDEGKCTYTAQKDCCGNAIKEKTENGKPGNECTCPEDYGECNGKAAMLIKGKKVDATYLEKGCVSNSCVYAVDQKRVKSTDLTFEKELSFFTVEILVKFNNPFTVGKDKVDVSFKLKDEKEGLEYPIKITAVKLIDGQTLFGAKDGLSGSFEQLQDTYSVSLPITYQAPLIEEERAVTLRVDYEYKKSVKTTKNEDGTYNYVAETVRDTFDGKLSKKIFFLFPEGSS
ncbi:hypothetical protein HY638_04180 [Candidatus Woesearchaeota archaeon]|nr:hypothetical protein [Candidatus Woesearchaeota archaeon]